MKDRSYDLLHHERMLYNGATSHPFWCNKGRMCYSVCGMVHIKEPLLLIKKSNSFGSSGFPASLAEWSFTIMSDVK